MCVLSNPMECKGSYSHFRVRTASVESFSKEAGQSCGGAGDLHGPGILNP